MVYIYTIKVMTKRTRISILTKSQKWTKKTRERHNEVAAADDDSTILLMSMTDRLCLNSTMATLEVRIDVALSNRSVYYVIYGVIFCRSCRCRRLERSIHASMLLVISSTVRLIVTNGDDEPDDEYDVQENGEGWLED